MFKFRIYDNKIDRNETKINESILNRLNFISKTHKNSLTLEFTVSVVHRHVQSHQRTHSVMKPQIPKRVTQKLFSTFPYFFTLKIILICDAIFKKKEIHADKIVYEENNSVYSVLRKVLRKFSCCIGQKRRQLRVTSNERRGRKCYI